MNTYGFLGPVLYHLHYKHDLGSMSRILDEPHATHYVRRVCLDINIPPVEKLGLLRIYEKRSRFDTHIGSICVPLPAKWTRLAYRTTSSGWIQGMASHVPTFVCQLSMFQRHLYTI